MAFLKTIVVACVVAAVVSIASGDYATGGNQKGMPYEFQYSVADPNFGTDFGHQEHSNGNVVQGRYYVRLPDGRLQTVTFKDEGFGLVADVQYQGQAKFPSGGAKGGHGGGYH